MAGWNLGSVPLASLPLCLRLPGCKLEVMQKPERVVRIKREMSVKCTSLRYERKSETGGFRLPFGAFVPFTLSYQVLLSEVLPGILTC